VSSPPARWPTSRPAPPALGHPGRARRHRRNPDHLQVMRGRLHPIASRR
jgi:hypothetical protein